MLRSIVAAVLMALALLPETVTAQTSQPAPVEAAPQDDAANEAEIKGMISELSKLAQAGKTAEFEPLARRAVARAEELFGPKHGYTGATAGILGRFLRSTNRAEEAAPWMFKALAIASNIFPAGDEQYKKAVGELVETLAAAKDLGSAAALYEHLISGASASPGSTLLVAQYRSDYGSLLRRFGRFPAAEAQFKLALELREKELPAGDMLIVQTLTQLAGLARVTGRFAEAEKVYNRALDAMRQNGGEASTDYGILLDNLGIVYGELGRFADAERVHRQALGIFEATLGPGHLTTAQGAANVAALYYQQRRGQEALAYFERARDVYKRSLQPSDPRLGVLLDNLGGLYRELGRLEEARTTMREALSSLSAAYPETHPEVAIALANVASVESELLNDKAAEPLFRRALAAHTASSGPDSHYVGAIYKGLADIQLRQGQVGEAQDSYRKAISIMERTLGPDHPSLGYALRQLAILAAQAKGFDDALALTRRSLKLEIANRARRRLAQNEHAGKNENEDPFFDALDVMWQVRTAAAAQSASLDAEAFEIAQWVTLSAAGRSVTQLGVRLSAGNPTLGALVRERQTLAEEWAALDAKLVRSIGSPPDRRDAKAETAMRARLTANETRTAEIDKSFATDFSSFAALSQPRPLELAKAQALLKPGEVLLQYVTGPAHTDVWAVSRDGIVWRRLNVTSASLAKRVETLRCGLDQSNWVGETALRCLERTGRSPEGNLLPFDGATAHQLYRDLIAPVAEEIRGRTILLVATGPLTSLPFQVLLTEPASTATTREMMAAPWLLRSNPIAILPAAASLSALRSQAGASRAQRPYLGVANPLLLGPEGTDNRAEQRLSCPAPKPGSRLNVALNRPVAKLKTLFRGGKADAALVRNLVPLPETTDEVCAVGRGLGASLERDLLIGPAATKTRIKTADEDRSLANYRIVHFATHGLVSGEIAGLAEPALVMTPPITPSDDDNGLLTASDIAALHFDADTVVLSACNTAAGEGQDGEALSGLARAFFFAGARSLVVSHWPVDSDATVTLMTSVFDASARPGDGGRSKALQLAMLKLLANPTRPDYAHPQMWAPFVLVGETGGGETGGADPGTPTITSSPVIAPGRKSANPNVSTRATATRTTTTRSATRPRNEKVVAPPLFDVFRDR
jgi:CHAT domain-containing protein/tetratricopeptide (TPR) repeat protein